MDLRFCDVEDLNEITILHRKKQARKPKCIFTKREANAYKEFAKLLTRHFDVLTRSVSCMNMKELQSLKSPHEIFANHCVIYTSMERKRYSSLVLFQAMSKNSFASMHTLEEIMSKHGFRDTTSSNGLTDCFTLANCSLTEKMPSLSLSSFCSSETSTISISLHSAVSTNSLVSPHSFVGFFNDKRTHSSENGFEDEETQSQVKISSLSTASTHSAVESFDDEESQSMSKPQTDSQASLLTQRSFSAQSLMYDTDDSGFRCLLQEKAKGKCSKLRKSISVQDFQTQSTEKLYKTRTQFPERYLNGRTQSPDEYFKYKVQSSGCCNGGKIPSGNSSLKHCEKPSDVDVFLRTATDEKRLVSRLHDNKPTAKYSEEFQTSDLAVVEDGTFLFFQETPWHKSAESFKVSESWNFSLDRSMNELKLETNVNLARSVSWECVSARAFEELFSKSDKHTEKTQNSFSILDHTMSEPLITMSNAGRGSNIARSISWDCISAREPGEFFLPSNIHGGNRFNLTRSTSCGSISAEALKLLFSPSVVYHGKMQKSSISHASSECSIATLSLLFSSESSLDGVILTSTPISIGVHGSEIITRSMSLSAILPNSNTLEIIPSRLSLSSVDDFDDKLNGSTSSLSILPKSTTLESISSSSSLSSVDDFGNQIKRSTSSLLFIPCASNLRRFKTWTDLTDETIFTGSDDGIDELQCEHGNDGNNFNEEESQNNEYLNGHSLENEEHLKGNSLEDNSYPNNMEVMSKDFSFKGHSDISNYVSDLDTGLSEVVETTSKLSYLETAADIFSTCNDGRKAEIARKRFKIIRSFKKRLCSSFRELCCWKK